ncbi:MAG: ECF-type sigma factor [Planctomycetota bacterium]
MSRVDESSFQESTRRAITELLHQVREGQPGADEELFASVYGEMRVMARSACRSGSSRHTLQPTALVHEVYIRLFHNRSISWANRRHFFKAVSTAMRDILVEEARRRGAQKRGGNHRRVDVPPDALPDGSVQAHDLLGLDAALGRLELEHPEAAQVALLKVFGGVSLADIAELEGYAPITARRRWAFAKAWIRNDLDATDEAVVGG